MEMKIPRIKWKTMYSQIYINSNNFPGDPIQFTAIIHPFPATNVSWSLNVNFETEVICGTSKNVKSAKAAVRRALNDWILLKEIENGKD